MTLRTLAPIDEREAQRFSFQQDDLTWHESMQGVIHAERMRSSDPIRMTPLCGKTLKYFNPDVRPAEREQFSSRICPNCARNIWRMRHDE